MTAKLTISRVTALPNTIASNTMYIVKGSNGLIDIYVAGNDPTSIQHVATQSETIAQVVVYSDTTPSTGVPQKLWFNTATMTLFTKYDDGASVNWVEALPTVAIPEFAGTGSAPTMAHSDHDHDTIYAKIGDLQW